MRSNSITRLEDLYLPTTVRFPLVYDDQDLPSLAKGFFPLGALKKVSIDLYFNPANVCMWYSGTAVGTISLSYTISNIKLKVEEMRSDLVERAMIERPLNFSYTEWYWQQQPITPSAQSVSVQVPNNFRWVSHVIAVLRKVADITDQTLQNKIKF